MSWLSRSRYEALALLLGLSFAVLHRCTAAPKVGLASTGVPLVERAVQLAEGRVTDLKFRLRGPVSPHADIVVVAIDERSVRAWGQWPGRGATWPRRFSGWPARR